LNGKGNTQKVFNGRIAYTTLADLIYGAKNQQGKMQIDILGIVASRVGG